MKLTKFSLCIFFTLISLLASCIEDGFTTSPSDQPVFSSDTLDLGLVYTAELTTTSRMTVRNPHDKGLNVSTISLSGGGAGYFRVNVDGMSGSSFSDVEIRANDSIYVLVEANLPENNSALPAVIEASLDFVVNGRTSSVVLTAQGQDIVRLKGEVITEDARFVAGKPYQITDSLVVTEDATLTLEAGARLLMHDGASIIVRGTLLSEGTAESHVVITGDRTGELLPGVSYDIMSRQWGGIAIMSTSFANSWAYTEVSNSSWGVEVAGNDDASQPQLILQTCRLRNSGDCVLTSYAAWIEAYSCEFAEAASNVLCLLGGKYLIEQCTIANYYLYVAPSLAAVFIPIEGEYAQAYGLPEAEFVNSIIYGLSPDVSPGDFTGYDVYFRRCLFRSENGFDDENFHDSLWGEDPLYFTVRNDYYFDYRLQEGSPAIGAAWPSLNVREPQNSFLNEIYSGNLGAY